MTILEVQNLEMDFGGLRALADVNFALGEGCILGLIGPNGSGKTTLFNVITGFLSPTSGRVIFNGEIITANPTIGDRMLAFAATRKIITGPAPYKACKAGIARTFQLSRTFGSMTVLDNVAISLLNGREPVQSMKQARAEAEAILGLTGLTEKRQVKAGMLGIVDRKRVELARALGARPKLLLLDEMMSGLNLKEIEDVMRLVQQIRDSGITVIVVEHVMKAVLGISDKVMVLNAGKKIFEGTCHEVVNCQEVIEAYLGEYEHA